MEKMIQEKKDDLYVLMLDIDNFKNINDTYGHIAGDTVLKEISQLILNIADNRIVSRYGGDEIVIASLFQTKQKAEKFAEKLR